jgi:hypothetical protein
MFDAIARNNAPFCLPASRPYDEKARAASPTASLISSFPAQWYAGAISSPVAGSTALKTAGCSLPRRTPMIDLPVSSILTLLLRIEGRVPAV